MSEVRTEFWDSEKGIALRLEDLAHELNWKVYNNALHMSFKEAGFKGLIWIATWVNNIPCKYCEGQHGRKYRVGQFLPRMPHHIKCKCLWDFTED